MPYKARYKHIEEAKKIEEKGKNVAENDDEGTPSPKPKRRSARISKRTSRTSKRRRKNKVQDTQANSEVTETPEVRAEISGGVTSTTQNDDEDTSDALYRRYLVLSQKKRHKRGKKSLCRLTVQKIFYREYEPFSPFLRNLSDDLMELSETFIKGKEKGPLEGKAAHVIRKRQGRIGACFGYWNIEEMNRERMQESGIAADAAALQHSLHSTAVITPPRVQRGFRFRSYNTSAEGRRQRISIFSEEMLLTEDMRVYRIKIAWHPMSISGRYHYSRRNWFIFEEDWNCLKERGVFDGKDLISSSDMEEYHADRSEESMKKIVSLAMMKELGKFIFQTSNDDWYAPHCRICFRSFLCPRFKEMMVPLCERCFRDLVCEEADRREEQLQSEFSGYCAMLSNEEAHEEFKQEFVFFRQFLRERRKEETEKAAVADILATTCGYSA
jgi:hypothetical protein